MTEAEIIKGCIKKDMHCQRLLFNAYAGRLMTICLRYSCDTPEAEDMLQETFIRIFSGIEKYRFEGSFEGWIKKITVNECLKALQKKKIKFTEIKEADVFKIENEQIPAQLDEKKLIQLISTLPDGYRVVFNLFVMEGFSHEEIAEMLNIQTATSRSQLLKARKLLQKKILADKKIAI